MLKCFNKMVKFVDKFKLKIKSSVKQLQKFVNRWWYSPLIAALAAIDNLIVVVPTDGILISSSMLQTTKWFRFALAISIGSTLGALLLAAIVETHGLPWILDYYPGINQTVTWSMTENFFNKYGLLLVFVVAATPLMQQPTVILASLANTPLDKLCLIIFVGRFLKFMVMSYIGSHAPKLLSKMWGVQEELEEVGISDKI